MISYALRWLCIRMMLDSKINKQKPENTKISEKLLWYLWQWENCWHKVQGNPKEDNGYVTIFKKSS